MALIQSLFLEEGCLFYCILLSFIVSFLIFGCFQRVEGSSLYCLISNPKQLQNLEKHGISEIQKPT